MLYIQSDSSGVGLVGVGMPVASSKEECKDSNETVEHYEVMADHSLLCYILLTSALLNAF
jgi:hypothetical protein